MSVVALVSAGVGVGLVPRGLARFAAEDAVFKPLDAANVHAEILVATRAFDRSPTTREFLRCLRAG